LGTANWGPPLDATHENPEDRAQDGVAALRDRAEQDVRAIIEQAEAMPAAERGTIGDLVRSFMIVTASRPRHRAAAPVLEDVADAGAGPPSRRCWGGGQREGRGRRFGAT